MTETVSLKDIKIHIPIFLEKKKDEYIKGWPLFKAYAIQKEFDDACRTTTTRNTELSQYEVEFETDGTPKALSHTDEQKEAIVKNKMAILAMTIAFVKSHDCMALIDDSRTDNWPSGQSGEVVMKLLDEFAKADFLGVVTQQQEMNKISMRDKEAP